MKIRLKPSKINLDLNNIFKALNEMGNPHHGFPAIIVAGTNGKGSVCSFLEQFYLCFTNLKVGKYLSPHLVSYTERISVNNSEIEEQELQSLLDLIQASVSVELTEFETLTLAAFLYFKNNQVDLVILEVGLGGRLDATNVMPDNLRLATALTNVDLDHTEILGNSLASIRYEKEAIKRPGVPHFEGQVLEGINPNSLQGANYLLAKKIFTHLNPNALINNEGESLILTEFHKRYRGRFFYDQHNHVIVDGAHNPAAAKVLNEYLRDRLVSNSFVFLVGFLDKDYQSFCRNLIDGLERVRFICVNVDSPRSSDAKEIENFISTKLNLQAAFYDRLQEGLTYAAKRHGDEILVVTGSLYLVGEYFKPTSIPVMLSKE